MGLIPLWQVHVLDYDTPEGAKRLRSKALVLTAPSYVTASLLKEAGHKSNSYFGHLNLVSSVLDGLHIALDLFCSHPC